ncbi:MAG: cobalamin-dependent protein [Verrucomicrobiae bacterium]|nr:cobalamin-dependent protein [Verrucomicrobiae bacterium]
MRATLTRTPLRILTAVPICDGHDSAITTVNLEFIHHGIEVVYLGYHRSAHAIVRAAIQEDVRAIGISSYNGGHVEFFAEVLDLLRKRGAGDVGVFGGGGGTISAQDARIMTRRGVDHIFFPGTPLGEMVDTVRRLYGRPARAPASTGPVRPPWTDRSVARLLTAAVQRRAPAFPRAKEKGRVIGISGPGGAGKTTLTDELVLRLLRRFPKSRIAVLSHDPSLQGRGALLGDRATMIYSQDDRVFMRSLGSGGRAGGLAPRTEACLRALRATAAFDFIFLETVGIGQESVPFSDDSVDRSLFVLSPDYGSRLQLQKIAMLEVADAVVINKSDRPGARTAKAEVESRLRMNRSPQRIFATTAKRHRDEGVDAVFDFLLQP